MSNLQDLAVVDVSLESVVGVVVVVVAVVQYFDLAVDSYAALTVNRVDSLTPIVDNGDALVLAFLSRAASFSLNQTVLVLV